MAKTIGKDKVSSTRARNARQAAGPADERTGDDPEDEDTTVTDDSDELPTGAATDEPEYEEDDDLAIRDRVVIRHSEGAINRGVQVPSWMMANAFTRWLAESYLELRKVTWPTWADAWQMTIIVILVSAVVAVILGVADLGFIQALSWIVKIGTK